MRPSRQPSAIWFRLVDTPVDEEVLHQQMTAPINEWTRERIAIGLLAPDIQKALLTGTAPAGLEPEMLLSRDIPLDWDEQRKFLGFTKAS